MAPLICLQADFNDSFSAAPLLPELVTSMV